MRNVIFASYIVIYSDASGEEEETDTDVEKLSQLISLLDVPTDDQMSASDFVSVDSDAETGHSLTDEEICLFSRDLMKLCLPSVSDFDAHYNSCKAVKIVLCPI